jgi:hypothetical protein
VAWHFVLPQSVLELDPLGNPTPGNIFDSLTVTFDNLGPVTLNEPSFNFSHTCATRSPCSSKKRRSTRTTTKLTALDSPNTVETTTPQAAFGGLPKRPG